MKVTIHSTEINLTQETNKEQPIPMIIQSPFPERLVKSKNDGDKKELLELFIKIEKKFVDNERTSEGKNISTDSQRQLSPKCKGQGMFAISCKISSIDNKRVTYDLGASINVIPLSIYKYLNILLKKTYIIVHLVINLWYILKVF